MTYIIRNMSPSEYPLLADFLYEAIYRKDDSIIVPRSILDKPELQVYYENFGQEKEDSCLCAEVHKQIVGAVWVRNINGYGQLDDTTVELAISLYKEFRGQGIGSAMMVQMLHRLQQAGYKRVSLAVQKENYAYHMYLALGFHTVQEMVEEVLMVYDFDTD